MNGIDKIIARMEADTQAECADIAAQAAAEAEAILAQYRAYTHMGIGGNFDDFFADFFLEPFHRFVKFFRCQKVSFIDTDYLRKPCKFRAVSVKFPVDFDIIVVRIAPFRARNIDDMHEKPHPFDMP